MATSAKTMPIRRVSTSSDDTDVRQDLPGCGVVLVNADVFGASTVAIAPLVSFGQIVRLRSSPPGVSGRGRAVLLVSRRP
jgi:hypothetical protein